MYREPRQKSRGPSTGVRLEAASYSREHNPASILSAAIGREFFHRRDPRAAIGRTRGNNLWAYSRAAAASRSHKLCRLTLCAVAQVLVGLSPDAQGYIVI